MEDIKVTAQKFMNQHGLKTCYECDGHIFKHEDNAKGRAKMSGKEIIPHTINAGVPETKEEEQP